MMEVNQVAAKTTLVDVQVAFKKCLEAITSKEWSKLFNVRLDLQQLVDNYIPNATNLTDGQKQIMLGDAFFLLIGLTLAENVWQTSSQQGTVIEVDTLRQKFFEPIRSVTNIFILPRTQLITGLLVSMLLKLSGDNPIVAYFFTKWQEYFESVRLDPNSVVYQLQVENEDDLMVANKLAKLYCLQEKRLSMRGLKTLL